MIQDIFPSKLDNSFRDCTPADSDILLVFDDNGSLLVQTDDGCVRFPAIADVQKTPAEHAAFPMPVYLFAVDETRYFLAFQEHGIFDDPPAGYDFCPVPQLRDLRSEKELLAAFTAFHLWKWYRDNRFCGHCAGRLVPKQGERALVCPACGHTVYPRINPAVIVGVIKKDTLLITRYRTGFAHNALVAGFTEIGETMEETVAREVMEETGIRVKNIRYYKSQPWGIAQDVLAGFFCDADGDGKIRMDAGELKYAEWVKREDIVLQPNHLSLTNEMMERFKNGLEC